MEPSLDLNKDRSGITLLQNEIRNSAKLTNEPGRLTTDLFSTIGTEPQKQRFETISPYKSSDLYTSLTSGELVSKYENYIPGTDNNERLAQSQTTGDKWSNGITKALGKTGNAILGGTAGIVYGVGALISDGNLSSLYDNDFSNTLSDWDTKLQYELPNLYTKQESEKNLIGQMGTANFWSDKFLGGLSFTAGAIISEAIWAFATGGVSLAVEGARLGAKLATVARTGKWGVEALGETAAIAGLTKYKAFLKTIPGQAYQTGKISKGLALGLAKTGDIAGSIGVLGRSAGYEASVEALQYKKEAEENFYSNFSKLNGRQPNDQEVLTFQENLNSSSNAVFATNMAILMPSNLITMGHILDVESPFKFGIGKFIDKKVFGYGIEKSIDDVGKISYKALESTTGQKAARGVFNYIVKPASTEGLFEEGLQGVTTKTANKWIEHSYNPKYTNDNLDTMGAFYESMAEQYGTKEGWVENGLGMIIGVVGGATNTRKDLKVKSEDLKYEASVATIFQEKTLQGILMPNRIQSANRIAGFSEEAKEEEQKGNISKSVLAKKSAQLTYINAKQVMGESVSDITKEVSVALDAITEDKWKESGVEASEIVAHKEKTIKEFSDLAKEWKTNKSYWQYMIGKKLVGEKDVANGVLEDSFGALNKNAAIVEALTWQSTIGENAHKQMREGQELIAREVGQEHADTLVTLQNLKRQSSNRKGQITKAVKKYKTLLEYRNNLTLEIQKINEAPKETEGDRLNGAKRDRMNTALSETTVKIESLNVELGKYADEINQTAKYSSEIESVDFSQQDLSGSTITAESLISLQDNIDKFEGVLNSFYSTNSKRAEYLSDILKEYSDSEDIFMKHQATQKAISDPDFKMKNINSFLGGVMNRNKSMNENTQEWLSDAMKSYQDSKLNYIGKEAEARIEETPEETQEEVEDLGEVKPKSKAQLENKGQSQVEIYKQRIENMLKSGYEDTKYDGSNYDGVANEKPTQEEIDEYRKLKSEGKEKGSAVEEKLKNWKLLDSAIDEEYNSIAQLIDIIAQLEQEVEQEDTKTEVTEEEATTKLNDHIEGEGFKTDVSLFQNALGHVTVKRISGTSYYRFPHLKMEYVVEMLGGIENALVNKEAATYKKLENLKPGDIVSIGDVSVNYVEGGVVEMKIADFEKNSQALNMQIVASGLKWSYIDVYTTLSNGDEVKMKSQIKDITTPENIYNQKKGDIITFVVQDTDGFNRSSKGDSMEQLKIYAKDSEGNLLSVAKAIKKGAKTIEENFLGLRQRAYEKWIQAGKPEKLDLGMSAKVDNIFFGSAQLNLENGKVKKIPISEEGLKEVIAKGYILDGEFFLDREMPEVDKTFVGKISHDNPTLKQPVIVFKKGEYNVAFPIDVVKKDDSKESLFDSIFNEGLSQNDTILKLNDTIIKEGIKTKLLDYSDYNTPRMEEVRKAFAENKKYTTANKLADSKYSKENLKEDVLITIDLSDLNGVISSPKLRIDLESIEIKENNEYIETQTADVKKQASNLADKFYDRLNVELSKNNRFVDIIMDGYTVYEEGKNPKYYPPNRGASTRVDSNGNKIYGDYQSDTDLAYRRGFNILKKAFESQPNISNNIISKEEKLLIKRLIERDDKLAEQRKVNSEEVKKGKKLGECK